MKYKNVYLDMDGVIADYHGSFKTLYGRCSKQFKRYDPVGYYKHVWKDECFFERIVPFPDYMEIVEIAQKLGPVTILSSPSVLSPELCITQKRYWVDKWLGPKFPAIFTIDKSQYANKDSLLIDDTLFKTECFERAGGNTYLYETFINFKEGMRI